MTVNSTTQVVGARGIVTGPPVGTFFPLVCGAVAGVVVVIVVIVVAALCCKARDSNGSKLVPSHNSDVGRSYSTMKTALRLHSEGAFGSGSGTAKEKLSGAVKLDAGELLAAGELCSTEDTASGEGELLAAGELWSTEDTPSGEQKSSDASPNSPSAVQLHYGDLPRKCRECRSKYFLDEKLLQELTWAQVDLNTGSQVVAPNTATGTLYEATITAELAAENRPNVRKFWEVQQFLMDEADCKLTRIVVSFNVNQHTQFQGYMNEYDMKLANSNSVFNTKVTRFVHLVNSEPTHYECRCSSSYTTLQHTLCPLLKARH